MCLSTEAEYNMELAAAASFEQGEVKVFPKRSEGEDIKKEAGNGGLSSDSEKHHHKLVSRLTSSFLFLNALTSPIIRGL